ncbi:hypothetical protein DSC45_27685 [Streptomyces sp. YIM 130001]|uniref:hypothetical protein n=1 Tax=Streptomyces sp. YIM 130001 TaxID=2259644 RepID=UPI000E64D890|nr:hypothetical protein [Streptomyces sp. YIM 130001]RII11696.1 hypothetical protein DSC45_27685 [Streptomyces sp. YIM 130001]
MPIESDQLVFDYLSRVGDLAQQRQLPSGARMRLVTEVRGKVERLRATSPNDSPATVRKLLAGLGTPESVVQRAVDRGDATPTRPTSSDEDPNHGSPYGSPAAPPAEPAPRPTPTPPPSAGADPGADDSGPHGLFGGTSPGSRILRSGISGSGILGSVLGGRARPTDGGTGDGGSPGPKAHGEQPDDEPQKRRFMPRPRDERSPDADASDGPSVPRPPGAAAPPHLAGEDELGPSDAQPDWWRIDSSPFGGADNVPGFVGGVEIPEILKPPPARPEEDDRPRSGKARARPLPHDDDADDEVADDDEGVEAAIAPRGRRIHLRPRLTGYTNPLLLLAAVSLVVGAILGNWIALGVGWVLAYTSRRLSPNESKFAALGIPGLAIVAGFVWLWGRVEGRWGDEVAQDGMKTALQDTWPWVVRAAAVTSALFLVWRSQRRRE